MKEAVNALVKIFTTQTEMEQGPTDKRREMRGAAQRQRVQTEKAGTPQTVPPSKEGAPQRMPASQEGAHQRVPPDDDETVDGAVLMPGLEVTYPSLKEQNGQLNVVSQDWDKPSQNTRAAQ